MERFRVATRIFSIHLLLGGMQPPPYTCPCCGYRTLAELPGSDEICRICFWQDDGVQLLDPWFPGGANHPCLAEAQSNYVEFGAMERRFITNVTAPASDDELDAQWRRVAESDRAYVTTPAKLSSAEYRDLNVWYYWRRHAA